MQAYEDCVARFGVEGVTLERVSKEAGLARALIRHNIGNREELLDTLIQRFLEKSERSMEEVKTDLPRENRLEAFISRLFDPVYSSRQAVLVSSALIANSAENPVLAKKMRLWVRDFVATLEKLIVEEHPAIDEKRTAAIAAGVTGIYFNVASLSHMGEIEGLSTASKAAVSILIQSLRE